MNSIYTRYIQLLVLLAALFSIFPTSLEAQKSNKGKDFWFTFMPNYHNNIDDPILTLQDSLLIFIVASEPTSGVIYYRNKAGTIAEKNFKITDISKQYSFGVPWIGYELEGFNSSGTLESNSQCETPAKQYFHVTSEKDVSVYALNQAVKTSEAFTVLPTEALGQNYYVMSYNSDGSQSFGTNSSSTPSQFAIVATQDSSKITVTPSASTYYSEPTSKTFTLNIGESYLVQARITSNNYNADLTGSHITSTKPIAVFGGHQRATVPIYEKDTLISRDCLIEQMPPVSSWGNNAFLTPYPLPDSASKVGYDIYRVLAAFDSTAVYVNGIRRTTLTHGGFYEGNLDSAATVIATKPFLVAHYKKTSQNSPSPSQKPPRSDPFMMMIPAIGQFLKSYRFCNIQAYDESKESVYTEQYITVVAPNTALATIKLDGNSVNVSKFKPIPGSVYSYAWLGGANGADGITDGVHTIQADEPICAYVYGYGRATSYGYVGGMSFDNNVNGISEQPVQSDGILISPNPTSTSFTVSGIDGIASLRIVNSLGMEVVNLTIDSLGLIDVSALANGVYFVSIRTVGGAVVKPIIVSH